MSQIPEISFSFSFLLEPNRDADESNSLHFLVEFNRDADVKFLREISTLLELNLEVLMNQNPLGNK